jgi:hypothetical protein
VEARCACGSVVHFILIHQKIHEVNFLVNKDRVFRPSKVDIASGRTEDSRSFSRNCGSESHNFVKKIKPYHAAAGEAGVRVWHEAGTVYTA